MHALVERWEVDEAASPRSGERRGETVKSSSGLEPIRVLSHCHSQYCSNQCLRLCVLDGIRVDVERNQAVLLGVLCTILVGLEATLSTPNANHISSLPR